MSRTFTHEHLTITAGWQRDRRSEDDPGQHFTLSITGPTDVWLDGLERYYSMDEETPAAVAAFTVLDVEQRLLARRIPIPATFLRDLIDDAQNNVKETTDVHV